MSESTPYRLVPPELAFSPKNAIPILLRDGRQLNDITPRIIFSQPKINGPKRLTLMLLYTNKGNETHSIDIDHVSGIKIVQQGDQLYIETTYFNPKENKNELAPRLLKVKHIAYGVHPNHTKEKPDFYIVADDKKYLDEGKTGKDAERSFPFWRLRIYGDPETVQKFFQPNNP